MKTNLIFSSTLDYRLMNATLLSKIEQLDLNLIFDRMLIKHKWEESRIESAIKGYRQFLYLTVMVGKPVSPTHDVDQIWHEHILHTNKYAADCQKVFGRFLHHFPTPSKWKMKQAERSNCSSPCCNHADCCNDNPVVDGSKMTITANGVLHSDCGEPAPGGCAPIGGSDDFCGGTTNNSYERKCINFDNPDMAKVAANIPYDEVVKNYFIG